MIDYKYEYPMQGILLLDLHQNTNVMVYEMKKLNHNNIHQVHLKILSNLLLHWHHISMYNEYTVRDNFGMLYLINKKDQVLDGKSYTELREELADINDVQMLQANAHLACRCRRQQG